MRTHEDIRYANHSDVRQVCSCSDCALDVASASNRQSDRFDLLRARRGLDWLEKIAPSAHSRFRVENDPNPTNVRHDLLKQSKPLSPTVASKLVNPVTFPSGCARLTAKPLPIGSDAFTKTIGIVRVSAKTAAVGGVPDVRITSALRATSSLASFLLVSESGTLKRPSKRMFRPSPHPSRWSASLKAAVSDMIAGPSPRLVKHKIPTNRTGRPSCARVMNGHPATAPPRSAMNLRRFLSNTGLPPRRQVSRIMSTAIDGPGRSVCPKDDSTSPARGDCCSAGFRPG